MIKVESQQVAANPPDHTSAVGNCLEDIVTVPIPERFIDGVAKPTENLIDAPPIASRQHIGYGSYPVCHPRSAIGQPRRRYVDVELTRAISDPQGLLKMALCNCLRELIRV